MEIPEGPSPTAMASRAPTEESWRRPQDSASAGLPDDLLGARMWPILPKKLALCTVPSLRVAQALIDSQPDLFFFSSEFPMSYVPFVNDFGPVNLAVVHAFYQHMHKYCSLPELAARQIIYYVPDNEIAITNAAFLLASYLVIELGHSPEDAWAPFRAVPDVRAFRDVTEGPVDYELTVLACLQGLSRAIALGWYCPETFDAEEYTFLNSSSVLDMSMVTPKFCAFRGPRGSKLEEVLPGVYTCPPSMYARSFKKHNVSTVVRLNEASSYDRREFIEQGLEHRELQFDDCTTPSREVVEEFLKIADEAPGVVAVHCKAGLGRTGTLIAIHMMKHHCFTAAECIGWLRIVRPGSVIGGQQQFLQWAEGRYRRVDKVLRPGSLPLRQSGRLQVAPAGARGADVPPARPRTEEPATVTRSPSELGDEIAKAQQRRDHILARAATYPGPRGPARRGRGPEAPSDSAKPLSEPLAPESRAALRPRPILRRAESAGVRANDLMRLKADSLSPAPAARGPKSAAVDPAPMLGKGRRQLLGISVGTLLRSVAKPFSASARITAVDKPASEG